MIILDTNVVSALMRPRPDERVLRWLDQQSAELLWTTAITVFEARVGTAILPTSRRREEIEADLERILRDDLEGRVLAFDEVSAERAANVAAGRRLAGRPVDIRDTQIAGIALANEATLATRNIRHFDDLPLPLINPWDAAS